MPHFKKWNDGAYYANAAEETIQQTGRFGELDAIMDNLNDDLRDVLDEYVGEDNDDPSWDLSDDDTFDLEDIDAAFDVDIDAIAGLEMGEFQDDFAF
ncbi:hypothetical protein ABVF61_29020 [Roseibium sp. HPY-6]|uniref:hypothetical protein n=1 Tax=Roseibium sp. HPY-6 TaxID=3229852 RepID=UPI0033904302